MPPLKRHLDICAGWVSCGLMDIAFIDRSAQVAGRTRALAFALASHLRLVGLLILCLSSASCNSGRNGSARQMDFDIRRIDRDRDVIAADKMLDDEPITVTASHCSRSAG